MKHKLKLSFWALGILVLVLSNLFMFAPARVNAAAPTLDSIATNTRNFSAYAAFHECMTSNDIKQGYTTDGDSVGSGKVFHGLNGIGTKIIGFVGNLGGDDGLVYCDEAAAAWYNAAGYGDVNSMMTDLGFASNKKTENCGGMAQQSCVTNYWVLNTTPGTMLDKLANTAKSKGIPTSAPTWGRYMLAISGLQAKCQPTTTTTTSGGRSTQNKSVDIVADDTGKLTTTSFAEKGTTSSDIQVSAFPGPNGGSDSTCAYLIGVIQDSKEGASALSTAMANGRIESTIELVEQAACDQLGYTSDKGRSRDSCLSDFRNFAQTCIDKYYEGNAYANKISRTEPFDTTVVSICMENMAKAKKYKISADTLASILSDAQNQTTPDVSGSNPENTDPCAVLGNDVPMRWLACSLLVAGSGMATTFYNMAQQLLYMPISSVFTDNFTKTAQTFRIIGMALIVIAGLVMIIAQATGSDLVDAYTIKKVLPKLGIALIGMAVALPLLKFAVSLTNDLGIAAGDVVLRLGGAQAVGNSATIGDNIGAIFLGLAGVAVAGVVWGWAALTFIGTAALALLIGVIVLAVRQMAIIALVLIAPLAIAASVLPGTDKLWKFWRSTLLSTLMMFPIIMMFLKAGEFMAGIFSSMASTQNNGLFTVLAAIIYFAPYFMIPLAFKMAGGLMSTVFGMMNDRGKGMFDRMSKFRSGYGQTHRERTSGRQMLLAQAGMQRRLKEAAGASRSRFGKAVLGGMAHTVGGYNLEARMSQRQASVAKELNDQIATGADGEIRGLTVDKALALRQGEGVGWRKGKNGREFQTLGGAWVSESEVDAGQRRWGRDHFAQQAALSYEMRKAMTDEQITHLRNNFQHVAKGSWGMTNTEAKGAWTGAKFENQNQHLNLKGSDWNGELLTDGNGNYNYVDEVYEKKGSSAMGQMSAVAIEDLKEAYDNGNDRTKEKVRSIAETFMQRSGGVGGMMPDPNNEGQMIPIPTDPAILQAAREEAQKTGRPLQDVVNSEYYRTSTWGAAHVAEAVRDLAVHVGVYAPLDPATNSTSVTAGTTNGPNDTFSGPRLS